MDEKNYNTLCSSDPSLNDEHNHSEEIDLKDLIAKLWFRRKFILLCTAIFFLIGLFVALASPVSYTAQTTLVPQLGDKGKGGSLGGLASMMGVNLGATTGGETLSPTVYPQIIKSVPFCKEIMNTPIVVEKSNGQPITLYEYYTDKQYQPINVIRTLKKYTIGLPGLIISSLRSSDDERPEVYRDSLNNTILTISKEERIILDIIRDNTCFSSNDKDGYITLGYAFPEPDAVAVIAQNLYDTLERYVVNYKSQKQKDNLEFVEESYERAKSDFMEKQAKLASFQDANRNLATATAQSTQRRLTAEYDVAYTVYNELAKQLEQAKISVKESTPVLTIINPVVVPHEKSAPRRGFIMFVFILLGLVISIAWVFVKPFVQDVKKSIVEQNDDSVNE